MKRHEIDDPRLLAMFDDLVSRSHGLMEAEREIRRRKQLLDQRERRLEMAERTAEKLLAAQARAARIPSLERQLSLAQGQLRALKEAYLDAD